MLVLGFFGRIISHHITIASLLSSNDRANLPRAYAAKKFSNLGNVKITETDNPSSDPPSFLTSNALHRFYQYSTTRSAIASSLDTSSSQNIPTLPIQMNPSPNLCKISLLHKSVTPNTTMSALRIPQSLEN